MSNTSKINQFREAERRLAEQMAILEKLKNDQDLKKELEFEESLMALIEEYGMSKRSVMAIIDPYYYHAATQEIVPTRARKPRKLKIYIHPETGEKIETRGGNHKLLRAWKDQYGDEVVEGWLES